MRLLIGLSLAFVCSAQFGPMFPGPGNTSSPACTSTNVNYSFCKMYALPTLGSTITNLPVFVDVTLGAGNINSASCFDVAFAATEAGTTLYSWGGRTQLFESCNNTTGHVQAWVNIPSASTGTKIVVLSKGSQVASQSPGSAFGTTGATFIFHGSDGSTLSVDESSGAKAITINGSVVGTAGKVGPGAAGNGTSSTNYLSLNDVTTNRMTFMVWWKSNGAQPVSDGHIIASGNDSFALCNRIGTVQQARATVAIVSFGTLNADASPATSVNDGNWHHLAGTYDGTTLTLYVDGTAVGSNTHTTNISIPGTTTRLFQRTNSGNYVYGYIDEAQTYNASRTADWIAAVYANQNNPTSWLLFVK